MKKNIISAIFVGVVLFCTPAHAEYAIAAQVTTDLNVRKYPDKNAEIIDVLPEGAIIDALDSGKSDWNKINFGDYVGYVYNAYLTGPKRASSPTYGVSPVPTPPQGNGETSAETDGGIQETEVSVSSDERQFVEVERLYEPSEFKYLGVLNYNGWRWTWYSSYVYNNDLGIPGQHSNEDGYIMDEDEYICLASVDLSKGTIVKTPLGYYGKVYDTGCPSGTLDVYTNWSV